MPKPLRILHVSSEVAPYSKTGGLGDVASALPAALARLRGPNAETRFDVTVVSPRYRSIDPAKYGLSKWLRSIPVPLGTETVEVGVYEGRPAAAMGETQARLLFIDHPASFDRDGLYGPPGGGDFPDNARRFTLLGRAALILAAQLDLWPDVVHGHDWQAGPALLYAAGSHQGLPKPRTVVTIHNLAFQGRFPPSVIDEVGLPRDLFHPEGYEFFGDVSFLKAGIVVADRITTVSPRYAWEIQTPGGGVGFDGLLRARADRLVGILNGIDVDVWNPARDPRLPATYSAENLRGKRECKLALQKELGLPLRAETPLCGSISRLTDQKGFDLVVAALPSLLESEDIQYVVLGSGEARFEEALRDLAARYPKKVAVRIAYDDALAHRIEAGSDLFVMPSRFEPCGLNQMYSLRYGTPPIVRATGGLDDTVVDFEARSRSGTGFKFANYSVEALTHAWRRALFTYRNAPDDFAALVRRAMAVDCSWAASAERYAALYEEITSSR
jgi:starch synthase